MAFRYWCLTLVGAYVFWYAVDLATGGAIRVSVPYDQGMWFTAFALIALVAVIVNDVSKGSSGPIAKPATVRPVAAPADARTFARESRRCGSCGAPMTGKTCSHCGR